MSESRKAGQPGGDAGLPQPGSPSPRRFRALPVVLARIPVLPESAYAGAGYDTLDLEAACADPTLAEALDLADPTIVRQARRALASGDEPAQRRLRRLILRYALRASTRATPFGAFAGVAAGTFGDAPRLHLGDRRSWRTRTRPDMGWLLALVALLERDPGVQARVGLYANNTIMPVGSRLMLPFTPELDGSEDAPRGNVSIRATAPVVSALTIAARGCALADIVWADDPDPDTARRRTQLVRGLIEAGFLLTNLAPPRGHPSPLAHVAQAVEDVPSRDATAKELREIDALIRAYDRAPLGEGRGILADARARMAGVCESPEHIQADLSYPEASVVLPASAGEDIAEAAEVLLRLSAARTGLAHLRPYHEAFLERYGLDREVPVTELISEETGLGAPGPYEFPPNAARPPAGVPAPGAAGPAADEIARRAFSALLRGEPEIELRADAFDAPDPATRPAGIEVAGELIAASATALASGDYQIVLSPLLGSLGIAKITGRFLDLLDDESVSPLREAVEAEEALRPGVLHAELIHPPPRGRLNNLIYVAPVRGHEVRVGVPPGPGPAIDLADIVVGATSDGLYLRSRSRGDRLLVSAPNVLNMDLLPNACRLLLEISMEGTRHLRQLDFGFMADAPRLPRVRCGRVVLSPATWRLRAADIEAADDADDPAWAEAFAAWCRQNAVPAALHLVRADHRLAVDCDNYSHVAELRRALARQDTLTLTERFAVTGNAPVEGPEGRHHIECVFSLVGPPPETACSESADLKGEAVPEETRVRPPGSEWLYLKLYGAKRRQEELLLEHIVPFASAAAAQGLCDSWHFLRYSDPMPHIRLRFRGDDTPRLLALVGAQLTRLRSLGLVQELTVGTYFREVERYGGPALIEPAEDVFGADSQAAAAMLFLAGQPDAPPARSLAALGAVDLLDRLGPVVDATRLLTGYGSTRDVPAREERVPGSVLALAAGVWESSGAPVRPTAMAGQLSAAFSRRAPAIQRFGTALASTALASTALADVGGRARTDRVVSSLIHMHCNRLGVMGDEEVAAMRQANRILRWRSLPKRTGRREGR